MVAFFIGNYTFFADFVVIRSVNEASAAAASSVAKEAAARASPNHQKVAKNTTMDAIGTIQFLRVSRFIAYSDLVTAFPAHCPNRVANTCEIPFVPEVLRTLVHWIGYPNCLWHTYQFVLD